MLEEETQFVEMREAIADDINFLIICVAAYDYLLDIKNGDNEAWQGAPEFFEYTKRSFRSNWINWTWKLFCDKNNHSRTLGNYLKFVKNNKSLFVGYNSEIDALLNQDGSELKKFEPLFKAISTRRHKRHAHLDLSYSDPDKLNKEASLAEERENLKKAIGLAKRIINNYSEAFDQTIPTFTNPNYQAAKFVVSDLDRIYNLLKREKGST